MFPDKEPSEVYALVLIDEIDAHMHPDWQQKLVGQLSTIFPQVQFIATTHSPLVVSGRPVDQVFRFVRDGRGKIVRVSLDDDTTLGRADQILTSDLFGLPTTLDTTTTTKVDRFYELRGMTARSAEEEAEFQSLEQRLRFEIPMPQSQMASRRAHELIRLMLMEEAGVVYPDIQDMLLEKAEQLLKEASKNGGELA